MVQRFTHFYLYMYVPALDRTFSELPGSEKESSRKLEELEKRAPSPLILTLTLSTPALSGTYSYIHTHKRTSIISKIIPQEAPKKGVN